MDYLINYEGVEKDIVNSVECVVEHDDVKVFDIDFSIKYPEIFAYSKDDNSVSVLFSWEGEQTYVEIKFLVPENKTMELFGSTSRYTAKICLHETHKQP